MNKEYTANVIEFDELEKALNDGFNVFKGSVNIGDENLYSLESLSKFSYSVEGDFDCCNNNLKTLIGGPKKVGGNFHCYNNKLTSLDGAPESVEGLFHCGTNQLVTLKGSPKIVGRDYYCHDNKLISIVGCPEIVGGSFHFTNKIISLEKIKGDIFKLGDTIFIGNPDNKDVENLINFDISTNKGTKQYYNSFINFIKLTTKINNDDLNDTDIIIRGKKFKRKILKI